MGRSKLPNVFIRHAVVDVGSNSVLLLVAEVSPSGQRVLAEFSRVTALGKGTRQSHKLGEEGMVATLAALSDARQVALQHGAETWLACATMAARIAANTSEFLARAEAQGTPVQVISGDVEAELGFLAVASDPLFDQDPVVSIIDPGGHSTEIVTARREDGGWNTLVRKSYPIGALGLRENALSEESPSGLQVLRASGALDEQIGLEYRPGQSGRVVTLGATGVNLISIREKLSSYQPARIHGQELLYEEISRAQEWLMAMDDTERAAVPGIEPGREKTLHLGALILERFLFALRAESVTVSVRGWRHALLDNAPRSLVKTVL